MYKKAKNLDYDDLIVINDNESLCVQTIEMLEYTVQISGFINGGTERYWRFYTYNESVLIKNAVQKTFCEKVSEFFKKCQFF